MNMFGTIIETIIKDPATAETHSGGEGSPNKSTKVASSAATLQTDVDDLISNVKHQSTLPVKEKVNET